jgi:ketosteroid isomerase-like protein
MNEKNISTVQSFYKALAQVDIPAMAGLVDPEFQIERPRSLPYGGTYKGIEGCRQYFDAASTVYDLQRTRFEPEVFASDGDHVFVLVHCTMYTQGAAKPFETKSVDFWRLQNGKLLLMKTFYQDTAENLRRLGE